VAKAIVDIATGQKPDREPMPEKNGNDPAAVSRLSQHLWQAAQQMPTVCCILFAKSSKVKGFLIIG
jgi:hypothetical protein